MSRSGLDDAELRRGLEQYLERVESAVKMYAETAALKLQNYSRDKAPWTDRTGHARQRLSATVARVEKGYEITLAHGVDYGIFLELAHEKRFAIIQPTILANSDDIMRGFEHLLEALR